MQCGNARRMVQKGTQFAILGVLENLAPREGWDGRIMLVHGSRRGRYRVEVDTLICAPAGQDDSRGLCRFGLGDGRQGQASNSGGVCFEQERIHELGER